MTKGKHNTAAPTGRCGNHADRLYDCTENEDDQTVRPTSLATAKGKQHLWYIDQGPLFYNPYFIKVIKIDDQNMEFRFLHSFTGEDLFPARAENFKILYRDIRYAWAALPSTAHTVKQGDSNDCGILFISKENYMEKKLPGGLADFQTITSAAAGGGDGKWPFSAGEFAETVSRLRQSLPKLQPPPDVSRDLESIFRYIVSKYPQ